MIHRTSTLVTLLLLAFLLGPAAPATASDPGDPALCYLAADNDGINNSADVLVKLTEHDEEVVLGSTGTTYMEAIAFQATTGRLFASSGRALGTVDTQTGKFHEIGEFGRGDGELGRLSFRDIDGLAFDPFSDVLYASVRLPGPDLLIQVDPKTGKAVVDAFGAGKTYVPVEPFTQEGKTPLDDVDDIAIDSYDGNLWGIVNEDGVHSRLVLIDKWTGDLTDLTDLDVENVEGLGFAADGTLLGVLGDKHRKVVVINTKTGTTTLRIQLGEESNQDYEAIACLTDLTNTISGTVFEDANENGRQDYGEKGQKDVVVELYRDANKNGKVDGTDPFVGLRKTAHDGSYEFEVSSIGHFVLETVLSSYPAGSRLTTDNIETAHFERFGESDTGNDFGFVAEVEADLELTKSVDATSPKKGEEVRYTISVTNKGPVDATGVEVQDRLPSGLQFLDAWTSTGSYSATSGIWWIGDIAVGQTVSVEISVKVHTLDSVKNVAEVIASNQPDPDSTPGNGDPTEDDQDTAVITPRSSGGGFSPAECTDLATINALVYDPISDQLFAGTQTGAVHVSNDMGNSWPPFLITEDAAINDIVASRDGTLYALTDGEGAFVSKDGGETWTSIGPDGATFEAGDVVDHNGNLYAGDQGGVRFWDGWDWILLGSSTNPFGGKQVTAVAVDDATETVYAAAPGIGVYAYVDGWWKPAGDGLPSGKVNDLTADRNGTIYAATHSDGVYRLKHGSWKPFGWGLEDQPILTVAVGPDGQLLAGTRDRGAFYYDASRGDWVEARNLPAFSVSAITAGKDGEIYAGTRGDGVFMFIDSDKDGRLDQWRQIAALVANAVIQDLVKAPNGDLYAATYGYGILYSSDGGQCWTRMNRGLENLWTYAIERNSRGDLFIGIWADGLGGVWRSTDNARNWEYLDLGRRQILSIAIDPNNEDIIYAGANLKIDSIFRSDDGGETWTQLRGFGAPAWSITVNPNNSDNLYVGTVGAGIFESWDGGQTFNKVGDVEGGPSGAWDLAFGPEGTRYEGIVFAATPHGVFSSVDWNPVGEGSEHFDVRTIAFMGEMIFGGTWGDGVIAYDPWTDRWEDAGFGTLPVIAFATIPETGTLVVGTSGGGLFLGTNLMPSYATATEDEPGAELPDGFGLGTAYPNPFNPQATVPFRLERSGDVRIELFDLLGRRVATLLDGALPSGTHQVTLDGSTLPSGSYLVRLSTHGQSDAQTVTLIK